ncbi:hypothetical protein OIU78_025908 [Salix suchowensis]|nr:hypothetical protein OIU78_025908 [Salix suchowensis]
MKERKCKCYICGDPRHFARECPRNKGNISRVNYVDNLHLPEDWDVMSVEQGEDDSDTICNLSKHEGTEGPPIVQNTLPYDPEPTGLQEQIEQGLFHIALAILRIREERRCEYCHNGIDGRTRIHCPKCKMMVCTLCAIFRLGITILDQPTSVRVYKDKDAFDSRILLKALEKTLQKELEELVEQDRRKASKGKNPTIVIREPEEDSDNARIVYEEITYEAATYDAMLEATQTPLGRKVLNKLYNVLVKFEVPREKGGISSFSVNAIIATECTCCCINQAIPQHQQIPWK